MSDLHKLLYKVHYDSSKHLDSPRDYTIAVIDDAVSSLKERKEIRLFYTALKNRLVSNFSSYNSKIKASFTEESSDIAFAVNEGAKNYLDTNLYRILENEILFIKNQELWIDVMNRVA